MDVTLAMDEMGRNKFSMALMDWLKLSFLISKTFLSFWKERSFFENYELSEVSTFETTGSLNDSSIWTS